MAKVHPSLSTIFFGLFLILIVSDTGYVHGQSCYPVATVQNVANCATCGYDQDTGAPACICCING
ncbi:hypothetical protein C5167_003796 [Papaver somniferum]|uniref:Uncharacterized protein n=1 Tax=Papaver somniferum TaxID=3469 RepID=A0A4Y7L1Y7_PAPSO|nr:hypothetical protein C5167_003796 [Papaver somniferum]